MKITYFILLSISLLFANQGRDQQNSCENQGSKLIKKLKEFDLNEDTQDNFSITKKEYQILQQFWQGLTKTEKIKCLSGAYDASIKYSFAQRLLYNLNNNIDWQTTIKSLNNIGARGNSLTLSSSKTPVTLKTIHGSLIDILNKELQMYQNGKLKIDERIKHFAGTRNDQHSVFRLSEWENLINSLQICTDFQKIDQINHFFNTIIKACPDNTEQKNRDYWQSPIETLVRGKGDCEDFALAKYISLRMLGFTENQLFISIIRLPMFGELHAVLLYYPENENDPFVLDNLSVLCNGWPNLRPVKLSDRISQNNIKPLIAFNENTYFQFDRGLKRNRIEKNPMSDIPTFAMVIYNSKNLLSNISG